LGFGRPPLSAFRAQSGLRSEEIWDLNAGGLFTDTDGITRRFTDKNLIQPGWVLRLPTTPSSTRPGLLRLLRCHASSGAAVAADARIPHSRLGWRTVTTAGGGTEIDRRVVTSRADRPGLDRGRRSPRRSASVQPSCARPACGSGPPAPAPAQFAAAPGWLLAPRPPEARRAAAAAERAAGESAVRLDVALRALRVGLEDRAKGDVPNSWPWWSSGRRDRCHPGRRRRPASRPWAAVNGRRWRVAASTPIPLQDRELRAPAPCPLS